MAQRRSRSNYLPTVRDRGTRSAGLPRHSPLQSTPVRTKVIVLHSSTTNRFTLVDAIPSRRIAVVVIAVQQVTADGQHLLELYFGTEANLTDAATAKDDTIDRLTIPDLGSDSTAIYPDRRRPRGKTNQSLSARWTSAPASATTHKITIQYAEEFR